MWPFNRKKKDQSVYPQEVQNYYQAENRERTGVAWVLAIGTLVGTILLAAALFFGGRWVYRTVFDNNSSDETSQTQNGQISDESAVDERPEAPQGDDQDTVLPGNDTREPSTTDTTTETPPQPQTNTPPSIPSTGELPRTGPSEDN